MLALMLRGKKKKKKITEGFEMLVKFLELKPIGLKVRVR